MPLSRKGLPLFLFTVLWAGYSFAEKTESRYSRSLQPVSLPGGAGGIGFDDLGFAPTLKKILVPGGRTGILYLIDPSTHEVTSISGFSSQEQYQGGHGEGITSADEGDGLIFVTDRSAKVLNAVDPKLRKTVASAPLASDPDYVRYIPSTHEVWVTQPDSDRLEVFSLSQSDKLILSHSAFISISGGPESLSYDATRQRAYTHLWAGKTVAIDVKSRKVLAEWPNGCQGSRGIALDEKLGFLFAGCSEGKASVLDLNHEGKPLATLSAGSGIDVISYNPRLRHLYLPGSKSATLSIVGVSREGHLKLIGEVKTQKHSHCATSDDLGNVWVCDPDHGQLLLFEEGLSENFRESPPAHLNVIAFFHHGREPR